jgi:hypothetical protein
MNHPEEARLAAARDLLMVENIIDFAGYIENFTDRQRIAATRLILDSIAEEGTIQKIRDLCSKDRYDD